LAERALSCNPESIAFMVDFGLGGLIRAKIHADRATRAEETTGSARAVRFQPEPPCTSKANTPTAVFCASAGRAARRRPQFLAGCDSLIRDRLRVIMWATKTVKPSKAQQTAALRIAIPGHKDRCLTFIAPAGTSGAGWSSFRARGWSPSKSRRGGGTPVFARAKIASPLSQGFYRVWAVLPPCAETKLGDAGQGSGEGCRKTISKLFNVCVAENKGPVSCIEEKTP
jgi:hypothetical protein